MSFYGGLRKKDYQTYLKLMNSFATMQSKTTVTPAKHVLTQVKGAQVHQIPLFPPLSKGDERGISGFFASLAAWREKISGTLLSNILNGRFTDVGCGNQ
jgi:hypothetical protein